MQVIIEPLIWWIWFGGGLMSLGTVLAVWPTRRRLQAVGKAPATASESSAAAASGGTGAAK